MLGISVPVTMMTVLFTITMTMRGILNGQVKAGTDLHYIEHLGGKLNRGFRIEHEIGLWKKKVGIFLSSSERADLHMVYALIDISGY